MIVLKASSTSYLAPDEVITIEPGSFPFSVAVLDRIVSIDEIRIFTNFFENDRTNDIHELESILLSTKLQRHLLNIRGSNPCFWPHASVLDLLN